MKRTLESCRGVTLALRIWMSLLQHLEMGKLRAWLEVGCSGETMQDEVSACIRRQEMWQGIFIVIIHELSGQRKIQR